MMKDLLAPRTVRLVKQAIKTFQLDLRGLTVLTECASAWYALTPVIAAAAGADKVIALGRDTRYGTFDECKHQVIAASRPYGITDRIVFTSDRKDPRIAGADIVTNLGMLRPLDKEFLAQLKSSAVIPLMWETWEYRPEDLDLEECRRLGIPVVGTNEHHTDLQIFPYVGWLAVKLLFEMKIEVFRSRIVVLGQGEFAELTVSALEAAGAAVRLINSNEPHVLWGDQHQSFLANADAILVMDHHSRAALIGDSAPIKPHDLAKVNPSLAVVHVSGGVDRESLVSHGIDCWPDRFAPAGYMSAATDYLGPRPMIDLHTAGLKVGEVLKVGNRVNNSVCQSINNKNNCELLMYF
jgi:hypothetical protein